MKGPAGFESYYEELYGSRWHALRQALISQEAAVGICVRGARPYYLDPASVLAAAVLRPEPGHAVLDLCAAPGGKALVLAGMLAGEGSLTANDRSAARRARLASVLRDSLPQEYSRSITVTGHDAARWAQFHRCSYDRILADVPCSSEQHVLGSEKALAQWSQSRTKRLAQGAYAIGCAGCDSLNVGGVMVYSTCALSERENDSVVERLLSRGSGTVELVETDRLVAETLEQLSRAQIPGAPEITVTGSFERTALLRPERTRYGYHILPDTSWAGPIYFAVLRRTACNSQ